MYYREIETDPVAAALRTRNLKKNAADRLKLVAAKRKAAKGNK